MSAPSPPLCLFGASPTTANLGVSALHHATLGLIQRRVPGADLTVFDYGDGERWLEFRVQGGLHKIRHMGAHASRRLWRADSLWTMRMAGRLGGLGNGGVRRIREARAVLDVSGGDSFSDIYGPKRFWGVALPKLIALEQDTPLILLPQTYGPFRSPRFRDVACSIVRGAHRAWARDERSFKVLRELLGSDFDPDRHQSGVDLAFGLESHEPSQPLPEDIERWLTSDDRPVVGINVSGLLYHSEERQRDLNFRASYDQLMVTITTRLLREGEARVVLIPHVLAPPGHYESDPGACEDLARRLGPDLSDSLLILPPVLDACETKHVIGRLDWLLGARMHATIAALSSGVPAAAVAYSPKFQGIFECCDQAAAVADPTALDTEQACDTLWQAFLDRDDARARLAVALPEVLALLDRQAQALLDLPGLSAPADEPAETPPLP